MKRNKFLPFLSNNTQLISQDEPYLIYNALLNIINQEGNVIKEGQNLYKVKYETRGADGEKIVVNLELLEMDEKTTCV